MIPYHFFSPEKKGFRESKTVMLRYHLRLALEETIFDFKRRCMVIFFRFGFLTDLVALKRAFKIEMRVEVAILYENL